MPKYKIVGDPDVLHDLVDLKRPAPELKLALGLDLGNSTGYSYTWFDPARPWVPSAHPIISGQLDLSVGDFDSGAIRYVRFRQFLTAFDPDIVFFEDAQYFTKENFGPKPTVHQVIARTARPIELLGTYKATVATWCEERNVPCVGYKIQQIKQRATGKGNANKEAIILAANEEFGSGFEVEDYDKTGVDNIADSLYCLVLGMEQYSRGVPTVADDVREEHRIIRKRPSAARPKETL